MAWNKETERRKTKEYKASESMVRTRKAEETKKGRVGGGKKDKTERGVGVREDTSGWVCGNGLRLGGRNDRERRYDKKGEDGKGKT